MSLNNVRAVGDDRPWKDEVEREVNKIWDSMRLSTSTTSSTATPATLNPVGIIAPFAGAVQPTGWLLCDGSAVLRSTYTELFALIGVTYGAGDGTTTFNLPNLQGRVPVGVNTADANFDVLGETGGASVHTHGPGTFAAAIGAINGNTLRIGYQPGTTVAGGPATATYGIQGSSQQNNQGFNHYTPVHGVTADGSTLQPYISLNYIIKI
jgi:microcystin-dependent protein